MGNLSGELLIHLNNKNHYASPYRLVFILCVEGAGGKKLMQNWNLNPYYSKIFYSPVNSYPTVFLIIFLAYISSYNKTFTQEVWLEIHTLVYFTTTSPCSKIIYLHGQSTAKLVRIQTHAMMTFPQRCFPCTGVYQCTETKQELA